MTWWGWLAIGMSVGASLGVLLMACLIVGSDADRATEPRQSGEP